jgi:hypothetical protein
MTYTKIVWDALKKIWILPDGNTTPSFDWEKFHKFGDHLDFRTINKSTKTKETMSSTEYYERYFGRRSRPSKVDKVLDQLAGTPKKTPVKPVEVETYHDGVKARVQNKGVYKATPDMPRPRVVIKKSSSSYDR